jgi:tRNA pseudouridine32 synthase/23S rRNA pseudouridine746 synthase
VVLASGPWKLLVAFLAQRLAAVSIEQWRQRMACGKVVDETGHARSPEVSCQALRLCLGPHPRIYYYRTLEQETEIPGEVVVVFQDD